MSASGRLRAFAFAATVALCAAALGAEDVARYPAVVPGVAVDPLRDAGSHPAFRTEWWYVTGWLADEAGRAYGFQVTFFRARPVLDDANPSAFAAHQLIIAHAALIPGDGAPAWHAQRIARAGFGLAGAATGQMALTLDDWRLVAQPDGGYSTRAGGDGDGFDLTLAATQPALVNGAGGYSQKGPAAGSASYYYSVPQLAVTGTIDEHGRTRRVHGTAWLDHEWSSAYLDPLARGWDWVGLNLADGGALMAFRIRDRTGATHYAGGTYRAPDGGVRHYGPAEIDFRPGREWRSPRTGTRYPVEWQLRAGEHRYALVPLVDDQESDARQSTGAVYWEGAVSARDGGALLGRGFLELTGYGEALKLP